MITGIYYLICKTGIIGFSWWVPFVEGIICSFIILKNTNGADEVNPLISGNIWMAPLGISIFSFCKIFFDLSLSWPWAFVSMIWVIVAWYVPGGFLITDFLLVHYGIVSIPIWGYIVSAVADIAMIIGYIYLFIDYKKNKSYGR